MLTLARALRSWILVVGVVAVLAPSPALADPDGFNQANLRFNQWFLEHVLEPVSRGYNFVMPKVLQRRVVDFMGNIEAPRDIINSLLQWKPRRAGIHTGRFLLNTTVGVAGFYDVCTRNLEFTAPPETFDETFGVWGIPPGSYLILPIFGEFSTRSLVGWTGDGALNPLGYIPGGLWIVPTASAYVLRNINLLAQTMPSPWAPEGEWEAYKQSRFEFKPYEVGRELFFQDQSDRVAE